jgi:hypothetical protein
MSVRLQKKTIIFMLFFVLVFSLGLASQEEQEASPEYRLFMRARRIEDPIARITELERIKSDYPNSKYADLIQLAITNAKIELSTSLEEIIKLQSTKFQKAAGLNRLFMFYNAGLDILQHTRISQFDKKKVTQIILLYADEAEKFAKNPEFLQKLPERQKPFIQKGLALCYLMISQAYLNEGSPQKAQEALDLYVENGGEKDNAFWYAQGVTFDQLGRTQEAFNSFFHAAVGNFEDSIERARGLYKKLYGNLEGFDSQLEARQRELPFHPSRFKPTQEWRAKAVLAELFTGSECLPCVAADVGFDGLFEAYSQDHLVVLEYHLSIPRPDPLMNEATRARAYFYKVNSTPIVYIDGEKQLSGGGPLQRAKEKFDGYATEINARIYESPKVRLQVSAQRNGDEIRVNVSFDKEIASADYNLALLEEEVKYAGENGIFFHKNVIRDFRTVLPKEIKKRDFVFNLLDAERNGAQRLSDYEKEANFTFKEKHYTIDRSRLKVVFFVQERSTYKVYNAVMCDVE